MGARLSTIGEPTGGALALGYAFLLAVNTVVGAGLFGVTDNGSLSNSYPTEVTPAGWTFAIWGPIFLLQGGGTAFYALGGAADAGRAAAIGAPWLLTWMLENSWQGCFLTAPMPPASATRGRKLATSLPCAALLVGAHAAMMAAALNLRGSSTAVAASPLGALLVDFATGLNAGWLAAASGIGISLAASHAPTTAIRRLAEPRGAGWLLAALGTYGGCASAYLASSPHSLCVGAGYAAATAWACRGILGRQALAPQVARSARFGIRAVLVGLAAGALKAFSKR